MPNHAIERNRQQSPRFGLASQGEPGHRERARMGEAVAHRERSVHL